MAFPSTQERFRKILAPEDRERLPAYAALADALSESVVACELLESVDVRQQNPTLVFAALHYLALRRTPSLTPLYQPLWDGEAVDPVAFARDVVTALEANPELVRAELWRSTQTNEVNRSAVLATVIGDLAAKRGDTFINLLDVGTSMGLNLYPDLQRIREVDDAFAGTLVTSSLEPGFVTHRPPTVQSRVGIDPNPLDPANPDDVLWLKACLWPEEQRRLRRFDALLDEVAGWPPATRLEGTALERLNDALLLGDDDLPTYVMNSWVAAYMTPEEQRELRDALTVHLSERELVWISFEHPLLVPGFGFPPPPHDAPRPGATEIVVTTSQWPAAHWGWCHPHGHWFSAASGPKA